MAFFKVLGKIMSEFREYSLNMHELEESLGEVFGEVFLTFNIPGTTYIF